MSQVPAAGRERAQELGAKAEVAAMAATVASAGGAAVAAVLGVAAAPIVGPLGLFAALFGLLRWKAKLLADDPPDPRFAEPVAPEWIAFNEDWARSRPLELPGAPEFGLALGMINGSQALLGAAVTAFERAQGATEAGATVQAQLRIAETGIFARESAWQLDRAAVALERLSSRFSTPSWRAALQAADESDAPEAGLARVQLSDYFDGSGVEEVLQAVLLGLGSDRSVSARDLPAALTAAATATDRLGTFLASWRPLGAFVDEPEPGSEPGYRSEHGSGPEPEAAG